MKTTIKITLTEEQREEITKGKKSVIEKARTEAIKKINDEYDKKVVKLNNLYKTTNVNIDDESEDNTEDNTEITSTESKKRLTNDLLTQLFNEGKSAKEIALMYHMNKTYIGNKMKTLGLVSKK